MKLPRFTLRDLFWLVLVVATGCAWWLEHAGSRTTVRELSYLKFKLSFTSRQRDETAELLRMRELELAEFRERAETLAEMIEFLDPQTQADLVRAVADAKKGIKPAAADEWPKSESILDP